ncbi:zinc finger protein ush-like [Uloborus diversus]|uniref:zinc finger protein ush-like n=1 Tax=Uloborus diversus TaxID=327109 RepID=UPI00240A95D6|nr:zinc finger protein ush-like [Uloborus diversus]
MSRRKQSNPKPLKRKTEEGLEEIADLLHLPTELFSVRDPEDDIHEYTLFTKRPMRQGTSFGPYNGHVTDGDKDSNLHVIKTKGKDGENVHFTLLDEIGGWLKLLRPASSCDTCNASLLHNDSVIWCTVSADLEPDTELVVNRCFAGSTSPPSPLRSESPLRSRSKRLLRRSSPERDVKEEEVFVKRESGIFHPDRDIHPDRDVHPTDEKKSPSSEDQGRIFNGRLSSEDAVKYEVSSPSSPPSSATSPSSSTAKGIPGETVASDEAAIPYINGYHYPPAFPYGGVLSASDGSFKCEACDVFFNNRRNLEVHQTYYCQGKTSSGALTSSDTEVEDTVNQKTTAIMGSPSASEDGDTPTLKEHLSSKASHPELLPPDDSQTHSKRRRATSLNDLPPTIAKHSRVFKCPYCSYSSDKKASLTRHIRMHGSSAGADGHEIPLPTPPMARYCANCDIQFASYKNYQVHKEFYCNTRHVHKSTNSSSPNQTQQHSQAPQKVQVGAALPVSAQTSQSPDVALQQQTETAASNKNYNVVLNHQPLYAAISTSPLILVPCSYVAGGGLSPGLVQAGNIVIPPSSPEAANDSPNVIPTYTVLPGASGELSSSSPPTASGEESLPKEDIKPPIAKTPTTKVPKREPSRSPEEAVTKEDAEKPLDLSFRKRDSDSLSARKTKLDGGAAINSFTSASSSSCEDSAIPQTPAPLSLMPVLTSPLDLNNVISRGSGLDPLAPPPVIVKQGTSKCQECNIVFYKHENYLVHKNRYCAARVQKPDVSSPEKGRVDEEEHTSSSAKDESGRSSQKSPIASPRISNSRSPPNPEHSSDSGGASPSHIPQSMLQYYCMACGIKYTSVDNLRAHQLYYCLKRDTSSNPMTLVPSFPPRAASSQEFRCGKCKNAYPTEDLLRQHPCVVQRKCPYCDVYCPTLSAAQRHLVSHTGIKSFRCSLCGYKGHTLRGMRTHIRIHLDKNSSTPEEAYIVCMDEGGTEIGCAGRKASSSTRSLNSDRIKSVIATEPPLHSETSLMVNPLPTVAPMDIVAIKTVTEDPVATGDTTHWCQICGYSSSYKGNVVRHVKLVHKDLVTNQAMSSVVNSRPSVETVSKVTEPHPVEHSSSQSASQDHISLADHSNSSSSSMDVKPIVNGVLGKTEIQRLDISDKSPPLMKTENISPPPSSMNSKGVKRPLPEDSQCSGTFSSSSKVGPKYCKSCDISFNYLSNFLAHKKFYCTPRPGEVPGQESSSVQSVQ